MGALLVHDICNPASKAYPTTLLRNPIELFKDGAFHGGVWRCGFKVGSIGETAALRYYLGAYGPTVSCGKMGVEMAMYPSERTPPPFLSLQLVMAVTGMTAFAVSYFAA